MGRKSEGNVNSKIGEAKSKVKEANLILLECQQMWAIVCTVTKRNLTQDFT